MSQNPEEIARSLEVEIDAWLAQVPGVLLRHLLVKWREEMLDRWASDSLGDSKSEEQLRGQVIFVAGLIEKLNGKSLVEEMTMKGVR